MTSITWAGPTCVQEAAAILGPQNRTQGRCVCYTDATILINSYFEGEDEFDKIFCKSILDLEHILTVSHLDTKLLTFSNATIIYLIEIAPICFR